MEYPKISIVTPSFNQGQFLEETILSVITQGYPNLEYIIIDGGSTDHSVEIIRKYEQHLSYWVSEPDKGMYYALQKGFEKSTGEIMGWLNSDDMLHPKSLFTIAEFLTKPGIEWIQGVPTFYDGQGRCYNIISGRRWSRLKYFLNKGEFIQQESTYWTRNLWDKAGSYISTQYKLAGDFELWGRFFEHARLYTPNYLIGGFRFSSENQLSTDKVTYANEMKIILEEKIERAGESWKKKIKNIHRLEKLRNFAVVSRLLNCSFVIRRIDAQIVRLMDFPERISLK